MDNKKIKKLLSILLLALAVGVTVYSYTRTTESLSYKEIKSLLFILKAIIIGIAIKMLYDVGKK